MEVLKPLIQQINFFKLFKLELKNTGELPVKKLLTDEEFEISEILDVICDFLEEYDQFEFNISGFNLELKVDIRYDFFSIIETIPNILLKIKKDENFTLEMFEQGIERIISFNFINNYYFVECIDLITKDSVSLVTYELDKIETRHIFQTLLDNFISYVNNIDSSFKEKEAVINWLK